ncbi:MAG: nucleoside hydrolase [Candidatus Paceibacterota bacterium]|jgi:inosine-uridine nucleoside N-ribohydrolase
MIKNKIIIDCDPGVDDALAIIFVLQSPKLEILGITTVAGNRDLKSTTRNALRVLSSFNITTIPVCAGASKPLSRNLYEPKEDSSHGIDGLGDANIPEASFEAKENAVEFLKNLIEKNPGEVSLVAIGPLTNIANVLNVVDPKKIKDIWIMNGVFWKEGNATPYAEFNAYIDPEATKIVYESGVPIYAVGLDATDQFSLSRAEFEKLKEIKTFQAQFVSKIFDWAFKRREREKYAVFWDFLTVFWLLNRSLISSRHGKVEVEISGEQEGQTKFIETNDGQVEVAEKLDINQCQKIFFEFFNAI